MEAWQVLSGSVAGTHVLDRAAVFAGAGAVRALAASQRDKSFAVLRASSAELDHLTTRRTLARLGEIPQDPRIIGISPRRDGLFVVSARGRLHRWELLDPHPEITLSVAVRN